MSQTAKVAVIYYSAHFGGLVVATGYTDPIKFVDGDPYGTSHVAGQGHIPVDDVARTAAAYQGRRVTTIAARLLAGQAVPTG